MSALAAKPSVAFDSSGEQCFKGVVVYQDTRTRDRALRLCDGLVHRFWTEIEFDFSWWRFEYLRDPDLAKAAADTSALADWVIFSAHGGRELPRAVVTWIDTWSNRRANPTGALVALIGVEDDSLKGMTPIHIYLREVAQQTGMDYFPLVLEGHSATEDVSVNEIARRAGQVTSVLDDIIRRPAIPPRWGINE